MLTLRTGSKMSLLAPLSLAIAGLGGTALGDVVYQNDFESGVAGPEWSDQTTGSLGGEFGGFLGRFERGTVRLTLGGNDGGGGNGGGEPGSGGAISGGHSQPLGGSRGGGNGGGLAGMFGDQAPSRRFHDQPGSGGGSGGGGNPGVEPGVYNLTFDLYLFDSWDGLDRTYGTDRFRVAANGTILFDEALESFEPWENRLGGWTRPESNVYAGWAKDLIYRDLSMSFTVEPGSMIEIDFISLQNQVLIDESWGIDNVRLTLASSARGMSVPAAPSAGVVLGGLLAMGGRRRR